MLFGHREKWESLIKSAKNHRLAHGLLFSGPEQVGKKTFAIEFAKYLNCLSKDKKPCGVCKNCKDIENGIFPDFILLEPQGKGGDTQISQVRELIEKLSFKPYSSFYKIAVIDKAHLMTSQAQNCFLKFLEEPPKNTILILISEYPYTLLPTIRSRVQEIKFSLVEKEEILKLIKSHNITGQKLREIAFLSAGRPGTALVFCQNPEVLKEKKKLIQDLFLMTTSDLAFRFNYLNEISDFSQTKAEEILKTWLFYLRGVFITRLQDKKRQSKIPYSLPKLKKVIENLQRILFLISTTNINIKIAFENFLIDL